MLLYFIIIISIYLKFFGMWIKYEKIFIFEISFEYLSNLAVRGGKKSPIQETGLGNSTVA